LQLTEGVLLEVALDRWTRAVNRLAGLRWPELDDLGELQRQREGKGRE